ncbi:MAG: AraC family transcriptional regulator [Lachnospiraceae bacterium]|nr:AraC family transcriptional regulator [Lachnospiraceae bacterium]
MAENTKKQIFPDLFLHGYTYSLNENFSYVPHIHGGVEGIYVLHGTITARIDNKNYELHEGDIALVMPYRNHSYETKQYSEILGFGVFSEESLLPNRYFSGKYRLKNPVFRANQYPSCVDQMLHSLLDPAVQRSNMLVHVGLLYTLIGALFDVTPPTLIKNTEMTETERILLYLYQNAYHPITLAQAADDLGISPFRLSRICNQEIGIGFNAYLKFIRITSAKRRLAFSDSSISEIAARCGFESLRTFNRAFSEETGTTPRNFRKQHSDKSAVDLRTKKPKKKNYTHLMT